MVVWHQNMKLEILKLSQIRKLETFWKVVQLPAITFHSVVGLTCRLNRRKSLKVRNMLRIHSTDSHHFWGRLVPQIWLGRFFCSFLRNSNLNLSNCEWFWPDSFAKVLIFPLWSFSQISVSICLQIETF